MRLYPAMRQGRGCLTAVDENMKYYCLYIKNYFIFITSNSNASGRHEFLHTGRPVDSSLTWCEAVSTGKLSQRRFDASQFLYLQGQTVQVTVLVWSTQEQ